MQYYIFESDIRGSEAYERKEAERIAEERRAEAEARRPLTYDEYCDIQRRNPQDLQALLRVDLSTVPDEKRGMVELLQKNRARQLSI